MNYRFKDRENLIYIKKNKNTELTLNSVFSIYTKDSIVLCNTTQRVCPTEIYILQIYL